MTIKTHLISILTCCLTFAIYGQNNRLLIEDVTIIPTHINQVLEHRDVVIEAGTVRQIRPHDHKDTSTYDLGRVDGNGKYLVPSYADAHCHFPEPDELERYFLMNLANGVTTLRSMRGKNWHLDIDQQNLFTPRLILSSPPITRRDTLTATEIDQLVAQYKAKGFDFIKVLSVQNKATFNHLVKAAQRHQFYLAGHCPSNIGIFEVCESDVYQTIEHLGGFFQLKGRHEIDRAVAATLNHHVYHCATLDWYYTAQVLEDSLRQRGGVRYLPKVLVKSWEKDIAADYAKTTSGEREESRKKNKKRFSTRLKYLQYIYQQGAQLLVSPDASGLYGIPGFGMHTEMQHYNNAGIANSDILKAATYNLSAMCGTTNQWGTIMSGVQSDMVLLNANPLESISNTKAIEGIILKGHYFTRQSIIDKLKALKR